MAYVDFVTTLHKRTKRDYLARAADPDKALCAEGAIRYDADYWDGDRKYGYGGYRYDGRWRPVAAKIADHYGIRPGHRILDVGCGKGYLLYEFTQVVPGVEIAGIDISGYAIENGKDEVRSFLRLGNAISLPYEDDSFDLVVSITTLHNLHNYDLRTALQEIQRVGKGDSKYFVVESYRTEAEKVNFLNWQLTCRSFYTPEEWEWFMSESGYTGDYSCIFFE